MRAIKRDGGVIRRPAAGQLGCCCIEGESVFACPDPLPGTIDIIVSGITPCCADIIAFSIKPEFVSVNGGATLTLSAGTYEATVLNAINMNTYTPLDCTGGIVDTIPTDVIITASCAAGQWSVSIVEQSWFTTVFSGQAASTTIGNSSVCDGSATGEGGIITIAP